MRAYALLTLLILILWEMRVLRKYRSDVFDRVFDLSLRKALLLGLLSGCMVVAQQGKELLGLLIMLVIVPLYLLRKNDFLNRVDPKRDDKSKLILLSDGLGVVLCWLYCVMITAKITDAVMMVFKNLESDLGEIVVSASVSSGAIFIFIYFSSRRFSSEGFVKNLSLLKKGRSKLKIFILPFILGLCFASISTSIILNRPVTPDTPLNQIMEGAQSPALIWIFIFLALIVAPFIEEVTFRGYFYHIVKELKGRGFAILAIGLTFGILHVGQYWGDWMAILMVSILGFVLTLLRVWADSTLAGVVLHYTYNIGVTIIPIVIMVVSNPSYFEYQVYADQYSSSKKEALLTQSIRHNPEFSDAYNDLAWMYAQENIKLEEALDLINEALTLNPKNQAYLDTKAAVFEAMGRASEAEDVREFMNQLLEQTE